MNESEFTKTEKQMEQLFATELLNGNFSFFVSPNVPGCTNKVPGCTDCDPGSRSLCTGTVTVSSMLKVLCNQGSQTMTINNPDL